MGCLKSGILIYDLKGLKYKINKNRKEGFVDNRVERMGIYEYSLYELINNEFRNTDILFENNNISLEFSKLNVIEGKNVLFETYLVKSTL